MEALTIWRISRDANKEEPDRDRVDESDRATKTASAKTSDAKLLQRRDVLCTENDNALQLPNPSTSRSEHAYGNVQRLTLREMSMYSQCDYRRRGKALFLF